MAKKKVKKGKLSNRRLADIRAARRASSEVTAKKPKLKKTARKAKPKVTALRAGKVVRRLKQRRAETEEKREKPTLQDLADATHGSRHWAITFNDGEETCPNCGRCPKCGHVPWRNY